MTAPTLIFAWGNPSRGDDALGPRFIERVEALQLPGVQCLTDFQLQVEHALDLQDRRRVLFVDASVNALAPFEVNTIAPAQDATFTTHAMSPQAILQVFRDLQAEEPPPAWLMAIRGSTFELGEPLSASAEAHLDAAVAWAAGWIKAAPKRKRRSPR
ncbi:MAG TPA: hydrogenase maturation protease [Rhodocyclaceae bacterium]|nr:hydrogenase maturation protease [Rhodocyclaceae bacterium]